MVNFTLVILEFSDVKGLLECEQKWIDALRGPRYSINTITGNSLGYKHTPESKDKLRTLALGRKHSEETKKMISDALLGNKYSLGRKRPDGAGCPSVQIEVLDLSTGIKTVYPSPFGRCSQSLRHLPIVDFYVFFSEYQEARHYLINNVGLLYSPIKGDINSPKFNSSIICL